MTVNQVTPDLRLVGETSQLATEDFHRLVVSAFEEIAAAACSDEVALEADLASPDEDEPATARISLEKLFRQLPQGQATVIEMVKIEGLSVAEAARNTGQSEPLVKVNIHRGLKRLAALIEKAD